MSGSHHSEAGGTAARNIEPRDPRDGRNIEIAAGEEKIPAYLALPQTGIGPAVILVSTIFGVDEDMKDMSDELARRGCVALTPDFFARDGDAGALGNPAHMERAVARVQRLNFGRSMDDLRVAIDFAKAQPHCNGKAILLGFCFGGPHAWRAACDGYGLDASISFHGSFVSRHMADGDVPACPVTFHYGDQDVIAPAEELNAVRSIAEPAGAAFIVHPGAGHGYMLASVDGHYDAGAAAASWSNTLATIDALRD